MQILNVLHFKFHVVLLSSLTPRRQHSTEHRRRNHCCRWHKPPLIASKFAYFAIIIHTRPGIFDSAFLQTMATTNMQHLRHIMSSISPGRQGFVRADRTALINGIGLFAGFAVLGRPGGRGSTAIGMSWPGSAPALSHCSAPSPIKMEATGDLTTCFLLTFISGGGSRSPVSVAEPLAVGVGYRRPIEGLKGGLLRLIRAGSSSRRRQKTKALPTHLGVIMLFAIVIEWR